MNRKTIESWKDKLISALAVLGATSLVSAGAWMSLAIHERPTEEKVIELISAHAPYAKEQKWVEQRFHSIDQATANMTLAFSDTSDKLSEVIQRNTEAINALRVQFAVRNARDAE